MSFLKSGLVSIGNGGAVGSGDGSSKKVYHYATNDTLAQVEADGYFDDVFDDDPLNVGDIIMVAADIDGSPAIEVYMVSVGGSDVTIVPWADARGSVVIGDVTAYTVLAANSGKIHYLPDLTGDVVISLPAAADGLEYEFVYAGVAADAQDWQIDTGSDTNFFLGGVLVFDDEAGDEVGFFAPNGSSNSKLNVLTPDVATRVRVTCDGTNWFLDATINSASDPTFADQ